jgi:Ca2+-binding EF-hand superfamily protein
MGDMDFEKYVQAFQFLHVNASQDEMRKSFDRIDSNGSGYIDESEFLTSMVPDVDTGDYTLRNQLMILENKLEALVSELESLQSIIDEATNQNVDADRRNRFLKERLAVLQRETAHSIDSFADRISNLSGHPGRIDTSDSIEKRLKETFHSFDDDADGEINEWEFTQAWLWLGFRGEESEIHDIFRSVDVDNRGLINKTEFFTSGNC